MFPDLIQNIDKWLFFAINRGTANSVFDNLMPFISTGTNWFLVYAFLFGWLLWKGGSKGRITAITLIITIILVDQVNSFILKDLFARLRPCQVLDNVRLLMPCGGGKSFPSSHAANNFAAVIILSYFYRQYKWVYFSIAVAISYSRVYVGVHYPLDVLGGIIFGISVAILIIYLWEIISGKLLKYIIKPEKKSFIFSELRKQTEDTSNH
ncbi:MAG: phosphatase PAP2 family protein [FCB group bacterium]|jgi:undecaprenyl-diphosphatase